MAAGLVEKVSEKVSFGAKLPMLLKATSDNDTPTPGYVYQEVNKMTFESVSNSRLLVDFLNERLKKSSPHVKCKALKVMTYLSANGQSEFRSALRHHSEQIRQATSFNGSFSTLHADALNQKVRKTATELIELLFNIENPESAKQSFIMAGPTGKKMEGFGNTPVQHSTKTSSILDTMKGIGSYIPALGGYLKSDHQQDLVSVNTGPPWRGQTASFGSTQSSNTAGTNSNVRFVNYHTRNDSRTGSAGQLNPDPLRAVRDLEDGFNTTKANDKAIGDNGHIESQLVDKITKEGGVRAVPSRQSLQEFTHRCSMLDIDKVLQLLNCKLDEPTLDVQMKCLHVTEYLLRSSLPNIADRVLHHCVNLHHLVDTESGKLKSKANKVLYSAKCQSSASDQCGPRLEETKSEQKEDGASCLLCSDTTPDKPHEVNIFQGLQMHNREDITTQHDHQPLSDLNLLTLGDGPGGSASGEIFDPLKMGYTGTPITEYNINHLTGLDENFLNCPAPLISNQRTSPLELSPTDLISVSSEDDRNIQSDLGSLVGDPNVKTKPGKVNHLESSNSSDILDGTNTSFMDILSVNQSGMSSLGGQSTPASQTGLTSQSSLTGQSSLMGFQGVPSQSSIVSNNVCAGAGIPGQSSMDCMSLNPTLQSLLISQSSRNTTVPLNLAKPSTPKTDFDFMSKSKRESAFSFVQDEMKSSKK